MVKDKYKVLIITGVVSSDHDKRIPGMLRRVLESTGRFEVKITEEFRGCTMETVADYDGLIMCYDGKPVASEPEFYPLGDTAVNTVDQFVKQGKGICFYHSAVIAQEEKYPDCFREMCGCDYKFTNGGRKNPKLAFRVDTVYGDPICEDLPARWFTAQDDLFVNVKWLPGNHVKVLATVRDDKKDYDVRFMQKHLARDYEGIDLENLENVDVDAPVVWTNTYGEGRVFVPFIGHGPDTIKRSEYCSLFVKGMEWMCAGEVTIPAVDVQEQNRFSGWPFYDHIHLQKLADIAEGY